MRPSAADREAFERDGFLVLPDFVTPATCDALMHRVDALVAGFDPAGVASVFSTREQSRTTDAYFLESGDDVRFFFEEDAFDDTGALTRPLGRALNKIGHALHDRDEVFAAFVQRAGFGPIVRSLGVRDPRLIQSMYIFKQPRIGGEVGWHQDSTFLYTEPPSVLGLWLALEDATVENGCLIAEPGGHRGPLRKRFRRDGCGGVVFDELDATPFGEGPEQPLPVRKGTLIVLHGALPHRSAPNRSSRSRHAFTLHVIDGDARYPADNWLQRTRPAGGLDAEAQAEDAGRRR